MSRACSRSPPAGLCARLALSPLSHCLGRRLALVGDDRGEQRGVVDVLARADADLALPLGVGQLLVGDGVLLHALLGRVDDARAHGDAEPVIGGIAIGGGDRGLQRGGIHGLREARILGLGEAAGIDGEEQVGRAVLSFGGEALVETGGGEHDVGLDAGLLGEGLEQRIDQPRLAIGVDVDLALRQRGGGGGDHTGEDERQLGKAARRLAREVRDEHAYLQTAGFKVPASDCRRHHLPPRRALVVMLITLVKKDRCGSRLEPTSSSSGFELF